MKYIFTILISLAFISESSGQSLEIDTIIVNQEYNSIDTIYNNGTLKLRTVYNYEWIKIDSNTYQRVNESKYKYSSGKMKLVDGYWYRYGFWKYWYSNAQLKEEIVYLEKRDQRYVNQWTSQGEQLLFNGNGKYYKIEFHDSVVYEVHDSSFHGVCNLWSKEDSKDSFFLYKKSVFNKNKEENLHTQFYENGQIKLIYEKNDSSGLNVWQKYHENGNVAEFGYYGEPNRTGRWKYWDEDGILIKECGYKNGRLIGKYLEYYNSGQLKCLGNYIHTNGLDTLMTTDPITGELFQSVINSNEIPVKEGRWEYYDEKGELIRMEMYSEGKLD